MKLRPICILPLLFATALGVVAATALAQSHVAEQLSAQALAEQPFDEVQVTPPTAIPVLDLLVRGGWLMVPIGLMSVVVVALGIERALALRQSQILPGRFARSLDDLAERHSTDSSALRQLCDQFPSSAARIAQSILPKLGRPTSELERTLAESAQREADRLYTNVRTLNLAATITPLLGLLGTVWGMIQAFFATANMPIGSNKGQALAEGIYVALVTTFAGLSVAIPAAVLAHVFETRILRLMRDTEQLLGGVLPPLENPEPQIRLDDAHALAGPNTAPRPTVRRDAKAS